MQPNNITIDSKLQDWLARRDLMGNPFAIPNAEADPDLPHYYVDTILFDELLQLTQPCVIFGDRGSGKSAQRKMLAAQCRPIKPESDYLAIEYTYNEYESVLDGAVGDGANDNAIRDAHVEKIMEYATKSFADELNKNELLISLLPDIQQIRPEVASYLDYYCPTHPAREFFPYSQSSNLLEGRSNPELLRGFTNLIRSINLKRCFILMDGLDEYPLSDSQILAFLRPLLGTLPIIECPGLAFKFSLPQDWGPLLHAKSWFRPDRLRIFHIEWTEEALQELISQRFAYFAKPGHPPYTQLAELCDEYLATRIDAELIRLANGSPRNVLLLADLLFRTHCRQPTFTERITALTWETAKEEWARQQGAIAAEMITPVSKQTIDKEADSIPSSGHSGLPLLTLDEETGQVWLDDQEIRGELSEKPYRLLLCLYRHRNEVCDRYLIAQEAWPEVAEPGQVSDASISRVIQRLREQLGQKKVTEGFIETIRGEGYRLHPSGFKKS